MEETKGLLIINPCSGKGKAKKCAQKIKTLFGKSGYDMELVFTSKRGDAEKLAKEASGVDIIVCVGGDGTLNEIVNGLMANENKIPVGYIPMGSTNDFASSIGIPKNYKKAVKFIVSGKDKELDICKFNNRYLAYVGAAGLFTETSCSTSQKIKNRLGRFAYFLFGIKELFNKKKVHLKFKIENEIIEDDFLFVAIGNTRQIGGVLKFKGNVVQLTDGFFELLLIKYPKNIFQLSRAVKLYNRKLWDTETLRMIHAKEVTVYDEDNVLWTLDGEKYLGKEKEHRVKLVPKALTIRIAKDEI